MFMCLCAYFRIYFHLLHSSTLRFLRARSNNNIKYFTKRACKSEAPTSQDWQGYVWDCLSVSHAMQQLVILKILKVYLSLFSQVRLIFDYQFSILVKVGSIDWTCDDRKSGYL